MIKSIAGQRCDRYHALQVDLITDLIDLAAKTVFFCVDGVFADVSPQRVGGGVPWRTTRSPASAQFAEFNLGDYLPFKIKKCTLNLGRGEPIH